MFCRNCGSHIDDNAVVCPYCGVPTGVNGVNLYNNGNKSVAGVSRSNPIAIVGFVLSFMTIACIAGLVCSIIGYKRAKNEGRSCKGLARAGIIISPISIVCSVLIIVLWVLLLKEEPVYYDYGIFF